MENVLSYENLRRGMGRDGELSHYTQKFQFKPAVQ